jgi:hypothetical protein
METLNAMQKLLANQNYHQKPTEHCLETILVGRNNCTKNKSVIEQSRREKNPLPPARQGVFHRRYATGLHEPEAGGIDLRRHHLGVATPFADQARRWSYKEMREEMRSNQAAGPAAAEQ